MKILDILKPKSKEEILKSLKVKNPNYILIKSINNNFLPGVKYALKQGADIHYENDYALRYAAYHNHIKMVKYLIDHGANIHVNNDMIIRWVADLGHLNMIKHLIERGANIIDNEKKC